MRRTIERLEDRAAPSATGGRGLDFGALTVDSSKYTTDGILVRFRDDASLSSPVSAVNGTMIGSRINLVSGLHEVRLAPGTSVADALSAYRSLPNVLYAEPNYRVGVNVIPNDTSFSQLYGLHNTGQTGGLVDADIDAPEAWDKVTGSGSTIIAVIDTGVDYTHPDLAQNMWTNTGEVPGNGRDDDGNGYIDDVHGYDFVNLDGDPMDDHFHGTHVAGTIAAVGNNNRGVTGVIWRAQIMALKFLDASGGGTLQGAINAINYAVANGAKISNNSWGGGGFSQALYDTIAAAGRQEHVFVAAAGNSSIDNDQFPAYPASYDLPNIISVAATNHNDQLASFSNYGKTSVDLGAPGVNIYSTMPGNRYDTLSGTSMAAPHVAGVVALVRDLHPDWTAQQVKDQILSTVDPVSALQSKSVSGGRLNAAGAVTGEPPPDVRGPRILSHFPTSTSQPFSKVRVTFSESINVASFTTADIVSFVGPNGDIAVSGVELVSGSSDKIFDITFAQQSARGTYTMGIGPNISDVAGNLMDQDNDGRNGEDPADRYSARIIIGDRMIFPASDVPLPIIEYITTVSRITIDQDITIRDLDIELTITHPKVGELMVHMLSPNQTHVTLTMFNGGNGANFTGTIFDDEADTSVADGSAPFTGRFRPMESLSVYDNMNARGTWQLLIDDFGIGANGTLDAWALSIEPAGGGGDPPPGDNRPPDAVDDAAETDQDVPVTIAVLANDSDPDGDPLTVTGVADEQNGSATINGDNTVTFTPAAGFSGAASFRYTISDGRSGSDTATVTITVHPSGGGGNRPPDAVDDSASTSENTPVTIAVLANDSDPDGDPLTVTGVSDEQNGSATINDDGTITFTPNVGFSGAASFRYTISDGRGGSDTASVAIDVAPVNDGPIAVDDFVVGVVDEPLTLAGVLEANDFDPDGDSLTIIAVDNALHGTVELSGGVVTFTPHPGFVGNASFSYTISDGQLTDTADVTVRVTGVYLFATAADGVLTSSDGVTTHFSGADILKLSVTETGFDYSIYFDGSNFGLTTASEYIDAFAFLGDGSLVVSTVGSFSVPARRGNLTGGGEDLIRFTPSAPDNFTSGAWTFYFDGSDVGLNTSSEKIDAVYVLSDGRILISLNGAFSVPGVTGDDEDVLAFKPKSLGTNTSGTWTMYFDGSDVGLGPADAEDVDGLFVREGAEPGNQPRLYFSTLGDFAVPHISGTDDDSFAFSPTSLGSNTAGSFAPGLGLIGADFGLSDYNLKGFTIRPPDDPGQVTPPPLPPPPAGAGGRSMGASSSTDRSSAYVRLAQDLANSPLAVGGWASGSNLHQLFRPQPLDLDDAHFLPIAPSPTRRRR